MTWLDRHRVFPRLIAATLTLTAVGLAVVVSYGFLVDIRDGEPTGTMATVMATMAASSITGATAAVGMLGKAERRDTP